MHWAMETLIYIRTQLFLSRARPEGESKAKIKKNKLSNDGGLKFFREKFWFLQQTIVLETLVKFVHITKLDHGLWTSNYVSNAASFSYTMQKPRNFVTTAPYTNLIFLPAFTLIIVIITWRWSRRLFSKWGCNGKSASISNVFWYSIFIWANGDIEKACSLLAILVCRRRHDFQQWCNSPVLLWLTLKLAFLSACNSLTLGGLLKIIQYISIQKFRIHHSNHMSVVEIQYSGCRDLANGLRISPKIGWPWFMA